MIPIVMVAEDKKSLNAFVKNIIKEQQIEPADIFKIEPEKKEFGITQVRDIIKRVALAFTKTQLYILYDFDTASYDAQNAFLKTLEEHQKSIQFILVAKNPRRLLPTILSRAKVVDTTDRTQEFENSNTGALSEFLKTKSLKIMNSKITFDDLIDFFRQRLESDKKAPKVLKEIISAKYVAENNNVDTRLALDHLLIFIANTYKL